MKTISFTIESKKRLETEKGPIDKNQKNRDSSAKESLKKEKPKYGQKRSRCQKRMYPGPAINNKDMSPKIKVEWGRTETTLNLG